MVKNGDFNDGVNGWTVNSGGTATNNGYPAGEIFERIENKPIWKNSA